MKIRLVVGRRSLSAILVDSPAARDFVSLLPLTLTLEDYAGIEKVADLPRKLSEEGASASVDPTVGDIDHRALAGIVTDRVGAAWQLRVQPR